MEIRIYADVKVNIKTEDIHKENVIYVLTFINGKKYIGMTTQSLESRIKNHIYKSFNKKCDGYSTKKSRAIRKYLEFSVDILYQGNNLPIKETEFIKEYNTVNIGYNTTDGGEGTFGYKHTIESKEKMSKSKKGCIP